MSIPTIDEICEARAQRNQAWLDRMRGDISQEKLFVILRTIRRRFAQSIYDRRLGTVEE